MLLERFYGPGLKKSKKTTSTICVPFFLMVEHSHAQRPVWWVQFDQGNCSTNQDIGEEQQPSDGIGQTTTALGVVIAGAPASDILRGTGVTSRTATKTLSTAKLPGYTARAYVCVCVCVCVCVWQVKHKTEFLSTDQHKRNQNTRILLLQRAKSVCVCTIPTVALLYIIVQWYRCRANVVLS